MGRISKIFGNPKKAIPDAKDYKGSVEESLLNGGLQAVKLASILFSVAEKWLALFKQREILQEALSQLNDREIKCIADNFPDFIRKDG